MKNQDDWSFSEELVDVFYESKTQPVWSELALRVGLSEEECKRQWQALSQLSGCLAHITLHEPQQMTLNRLSAHARDQSASRRWGIKKFFAWRLAWGTGFVFVLLLVGTPLFLRQTQDSSPRLAHQEISSPLLNEVVKDRLLQTTLDEYNQQHHMFSALPKIKNTSRRDPQYSLATPVSVGGQTHYSLDSESDDDLYKTNLNGKDIEALFFRARKFEKQGYFREALKDYQFLAQFHQSFVEPQIVHIAMARCLESLGQKAEAIELLQKSVGLYGATEDTQVMLDQLKSQTF